MLEETSYTAELTPIDELVPGKIEIAKTLLSRIELQRGVNLYMARRYTQIEQYYEETE